MKQLINYGFVIMLLFVFGCGNDDDAPPVIEDVFEYHAHIRTPDIAAKHKGDTINIEIDFESHTGMPVHHISVRIYNKNDNSIVAYDMPTDRHVHASSGEYKFEDMVVLSEEQGFNMHGDWILEAKVWGHEAGFGEQAEIIEFHVHPM